MKGNGFLKARWLYLIGACLLLGAVSAILAGVALGRDLSHDESLYVSAGVLLARYGLLPYRDYPYLQMPNLALVYAGLFHLTDLLLLAGRLSSVAFAVAGLAVVMRLTWVELDRVEPVLRFLLSSFAVVLVITNPIALDTLGRATNHDLALLFELGALFLFSQYLTQGRRERDLVLAGALSGLAIGTRLSYLPVEVPFCILLVIDPRLALAHKRMRSLLSFIGGSLVSLIPAIILFFIAPVQFVFGNFQYHALNSLYMRQAGVVTAMDIVGKARFLASTMLLDPRNAALLLSLVAALAWGARRARRPAGSSSKGGLVALALLPFLVWGALVPSPTLIQYLYAPLPFIVVCLVAFLAEPARSRKGRIVVSTWLLGLALLGVSQSAWQLKRARVLAKPSLWIPLAVHATGMRISEMAGSGPVLTLTPIYPLEGGAEVYPSSATGPFAWRAAPLLDAGAREAQHVLSADSLAAVVQQQSPASVLTGLERGLEGPLIQFALLNGYNRVDLDPDLSLWVKAH